MNDLHTKAALTHQADSMLKSSPRDPRSPYEKGKGALLSLIEVEGGGNSENQA